MRVDARVMRGIHPACIPRDGQRDVLVRSLAFTVPRRRALEKRRPNPGETPTKPVSGPYQGVVVCISRVYDARERSTCPFDARGN